MDTVKAAGSLDASAAPERSSMSAEGLTPESSTLSRA
jgi:hypothetical protein